MRTSESIELIAAALAGAQALIEPAPKDSDNPFFKSKYADLAAVWQVARPALAKFDLAVIQTPSITPERLVRVTTRILHKSGQWIEGDLDLPIQQNTAQAIGSAITYGRRYGVSSMLGVVSDDDDDGNMAGNKKQQEKNEEFFNATMEYLVSTGLNQGEFMHWFKQKTKREAMTMTKADQNTNQNIINYLLKMKEEKNGQQSATASVPT